MLLVIYGKSCTGKTTLQNELLKDGAKKITTYTTRPMREGEVDGNPYNFISTLKYQRLKEQGFFLESVTYDTLVDNKPARWGYGSSVESYREAIKSNDIYTVILTIPGIKALKEHNLDFKALLLSISDEEIRNRQQKRGDDPVEAERRLQADNIDFQDEDKYYDFKIPCDDFTVEQIKTIVEKEIYPQLTKDKQLKEEEKEEIER